MVFFSTYRHASAGFAASLLAGCVAIPEAAEVVVDAGSDPGQIDAGSLPEPDAADITPVGGDLECPGTDDGPFGSAFHVRKATDSYAKIEDSMHTGLDLAGSFTIEAWVAISEQLDSVNTYGIVTKDDFGSVSRGYTLYMDRPNSSTEVHARVAQAPNVRGSEMRWPLPSERVGEWMHLAVRFDIDKTTVADSLELFVDGVRQTGFRESSEELDQTTVGDSTAAFVIGAWPISGAGAQHFLGAIDDVRVWNYPRTNEEIAEGRFIHPTGDEAGLVGYWPLDGDFQDHGPNGNDLAPINPDFCAGPR